MHFIISYSTYISNTETWLYLHSVTNWRQITFGTLWMTFVGLAVVAVGTVVEKNTQ